MLGVAPDSVRISNNNNNNNNSNNNNNNSQSININISISGRSPSFITAIIAVRVSVAEELRGKAHTISTGSLT